MATGGALIPVRHSFLRRVDPRTKLVLCLAASLAIMLPLHALATFLMAYALFVVSAGLLRPVLEQLRRVALLLAALFVVDALFIGCDFAVLVTLRLVLLVTAFNLLFATTTADEMRLTFEGFGMSPRLAFTLATACCSVDLVQTEWLAVIEAQRARGIDRPQCAHAWRERLAGSVALIVPAVVFVAHRAWAISEAAATRGFDSPVRRPVRVLRLTWLDWVLLAASVSVMILVWRTK